ncbi:hypothetical protein GCM10010435_31240 [Winogradskya consettensis]|uniref:Uncharacterized protein n=1 Tax=Winogradskya consettensis TaxID=113560 RepID=A0A919SER2_9ACTN|nr:hypothetical protein [Actinoplanes consettensis]GIM70430.1 hypothetical protein Aco04nite_20260 [Actinoplanes consettensis]
MHRRLPVLAALSTAFFAHGAAVVVAPAVAAAPAPVCGSVIADWETLGLAALYTGRATGQLTAGDVGIVLVAGRGTTTAADNTSLNLTAAEARIAGYRYANQPVLLIHGADVDWSLRLPVCADRLAPARVTAAQVDIQPSGQGAPAATGGVTRRL